MKTCATCKHWQKPDSEFGEIPNIGRCMAVVQIWDATQWSEDGDARILLPKHEGKLAFVEDGSDYLAKLKTMPSFGCVQHEPKESKL